VFVPNYAKQLLFQEAHKMLFRCMKAVTECCCVSRVGAGSSTHTPSTMLRLPQPVSRLAAQQARRMLAAAQASQQGASSAATTAPAAAAAAAAASERARQASQRWSEQSTLYYSNYPLDRAAEARRDEAQVMAWFNAADARITPVNGSRILLTQQSGSSNGSSSPTDAGSTAAAQQALLQPVWVSPASELTCAANAAVPPLFLGLDCTTGAPHFAVQVAAAEVDGLAGSYSARWVSARTAGPEMARSDAALMAVASGLAQWNLDAQYHGERPWCCADDVL
jgi:pyruvate/2-oxoglutarate dehydrogenase complex dihydrolipoamide acyltransferase (E2) component